MPPRKTNPDYLNGVPELLMLHLLAQRPMHGYDLVQAIRSASAEGLQFGEGCVYPLLHRLEHEGVLAARREEVAGRERVVYRVTAAGRRRLDQSRGRWQQVVTAIALVLQGSTHERGRDRILGPAS
jgi:PadR family transcriptional regulator, regulatory protein PadR